LKQSFFSNFLIAVSSLCKKHGPLGPEILGIHLNSVGCRLEVGLPIDGLPVLHGPEEDDAGQRVAANEQEHAHDDEEALVHAHEDGLHQHLECGVLARDGKEPKDDDHVAEG
jgi:hypothetical protein